MDRNVWGGGGDHFYKVYLGEGQGKNEEGRESRGQM